MKEKQKHEMLKARKFIREIKPIIIDGLPERPVNDEPFFVLPLLPTKKLVEMCFDKVPEEGSDMTSTQPVSSRGNTTAANVLSINLVAVWKKRDKRDAYLFTGEAHPADVTQAARGFLDNHGMRSFEYVDVPHHGSAKSNVEKVHDRDRGLAGIPAEHYLISHCGNHHNLSFQTVKDILKRKDCKITLQFLYQERNSKPPVRHGRNQPGISCKQCEVSHTTTTQNWHCTCMSEAKIRVPLTCHY